jgi:anti-sigma B factor antagonist
VGLSISVRHEGGATVVAPDGDVDLATVDQLSRDIAAAVADPRTEATVVDLSAVRFMDSAGIRALLQGRRLADEHATGYRVTGADGLVREVLTLSGVWSHLSGAAEA